jgi:hypothetical protein
MNARGRVLTIAAAWAVAGAAMASDAGGPAAEFLALQHLHAEELAAFANSLDAREKSLADEVRAQAMALAKKLDSGLHVKEAPRKAMSTEEALADKAARQAAADHARDREAAEGYSATAAAAAGKKDKDKGKEEEATADDAGGDPYPPPDDLPARFAAERYEILAREADFATGLSLDPEDRAAAATRAGALKAVLGLLGTPHWACERKLKAQVTAALAQHYQPWTGTWSSDRMYLITLVQNGDRITGSWAAKAGAEKPDGELVMQLRGDTATGGWKSGGDEGTVTLTLHVDNRTMTGSTSGGGETHPVTVERKGG